ncbi:MAG: hypothetical protein M3066_19915 [Actinomycetota bacterium]|nr:hypothetical protein [Actinomycetota bacterium]
MTGSKPEKAATGEPPPPGAGVRRASWAGTAVFVVTAVAADVAPSTFEAVALAVAAFLFVAGCAVFFWSFLLMAGRSRTARLELAQVYFLAGPPTPSSVRRSLLAAFAVQVVAALATAGIRPYTSLAAGVLVPMYGLALCGLWATRHGAFPPRTG